MHTKNMLIGLEKVAANPPLAKSWGRCGLVMNQASVTKNFIPAWEILQKILGERLTTLFGPQHGFQSTVQDNMIETGHSIHQASQLPVFSLYSETREPTESMLSNVDTIVVDLPITGCRIYTYKYTLAACLRAAKKFGRRVIVLDRPNPLGGVKLEGNVLDPAAKSFVGEFAIPMRHGLTMAEFARFANHEIGADLETIHLDGWDPHCVWDSHLRPWVIASPNMPHLDTVMVFPGLVLLEGTNLSEGRGTTLPFQLIGAPYINDEEAFTQRVRELDVGGKGYFLRPTVFQPAFQKHAGHDCRGFQIHVTHHDQLQSYSLGLAILRAAHELSHGAFAWRPPPYEYEYKKLPIEILSGMLGFSELFTAPHFSVNDPIWQKNVDQFMSQVQSDLIYDRTMRLF